MDKSKSGKKKEKLYRWRDTDNGHCNAHCEGRASRGKLVMHLYGCTLPHHVWLNLKSGRGEKKKGKHLSITLWVMAAVARRVDGQKKNWEISEMTKNRE